MIFPRGLRELFDRIYLAAELRQMKRVGRGMQEETNQSERRMETATQSEREVENRRRSENGGWGVGEG